MTVAYILNISTANGKITISFTYLKKYCDCRKKPPKNNEFTFVHRKIIFDYLLNMDT
jgi:hypothetical protein